MPKFAVYYVPEIDSDFYQLGSSILGYDIRRRKLQPQTAMIKAKVGEIDPHWQTSARPFGFHLTIGDSILFEPDKLSKIEAEMQLILDCFAPDEAFELTRNKSRFIPDWGPPIVLRYDPNEHLRNFHALVVSRINTMGIGSGYLKRYQENPDRYVYKPHIATRIEKFFSPHILGGFKPHFTLLNPYKGPNRSELVQKLEEMFIEFDKFTVNTICLLVQDNPTENWVIHKEYSR